MRWSKWVARYLGTKKTQKMECVVVREDGSRRFHNVSFSVHEIERVFFVVRVIFFIVITLKVASAIYVGYVVFTVFQREILSKLVFLSFRDHNHESRYFL